MTPAQRIRIAFKRHKTKEENRLQDFIDKLGKISIPKLRRHGFTKLRDCYGDIYINESKRIVVKQPGCVCYRGIPRYAVPTIKYDSWWIQSLTDRSRKYKAARELSRYACTSVGEDLGDNNCGYWKGVPVVFDW